MTRSGTGDYKESISASSGGLLSSCSSAVRAPSEVCVSTFASTATPAHQSSARYLCRGCNRNRVCQAVPGELLLGAITCSKPTSRGYPDCAQTLSDWVPRASSPPAFTALHCLGYVQEHHPVLSRVLRRAIHPACAVAVGVHYDS